MDSYHIGISGILAAQKAFNVIGNNISNAATEGYHRQRINLSPANTTIVGDVLYGGGVNVDGITRMVDELLQNEIFKQQSSLGQISQELSTLRTIENALGELSTGSSLSVAIDEFFGALQELSAHPNDAIWQNQVVSSAESMASQFRTMGEFLTSLEENIKLEADNITEQINLLTGRIAELNSYIENQEGSGGQAGNLRDQRDQCISKLSELVSVDINVSDSGVVNLSVSSIPVVTGTTAVELETGYIEDLWLGVSITGTDNFNTTIQGGKLGGLISLRNTIISEIHTDLDDLATTIIQQINQCHVQGVGTDGSFTELVSRSISNENLASFEPSLSDGQLIIRVTNTETGEITRTAVPIDVSSDTLSTVATAISDITGLTASVYNSKLNIEADTNYEFDFLPAVLSEPVDDTLTGSSPPTISLSGIYTGTENDTYGFTISGAGTVGNGNLELEVRNDSGAGDLIAVVNIGDGYAAGDKIEVANGIRIAVGMGDFGIADNFDVDVYANTDTSGLLVGAGINTFFSGSSAMDMAVNADIIESPGRVATALGADMTDNTNATRMADIQNQAQTDLDSLTPGEFYRQLTTEIGQDLSVKQMRYDNIESIIQNLMNQQSETSGVNINDEAAQMLVFEQMFRAMGKYLNSIQTSITSLMEIV